MGIGALCESDDGSEPMPVVALTPEHRASLEQTRARLSMLVTADYFEAPLTAVAARLSKESGCLILIDERALADAAIGTDTQVTLNLGKQSLRTVLNEALRPHALGWLPRHPGILITTQEQLDTNPDYHFTYLYPVADLVSVEYSDLDDYDSLIDALVSTVHPETWKEGGTGEAVVAPMPVAKALIITQSFEVQERITAFIHALREVKDRRGSLPRVDGLSSDPDRYLMRPSSARRRRTYWSPTPVEAPQRRQSQPMHGGVF